MSERLSDETISTIADLFRRGVTYSDIAKQLELPMSLVAATLCCSGLFRDQLMARRIVMNQMAANGTYVEDIAECVNLKVDTVKGHLRRSRVKYLLKPKEGK